MTKILQDKGYVREYLDIEDGKQGLIRIYLKYDSKRRPAIRSLKRASRPGLRRYAASTEMPRVLNGLGVAIISTSKGVMTDKEAKRANVGGEVLAYIY